MIRALFFDFDGVIVDTEVPTYESWRQIYAEYGVDLALADWLPVVGAGTSTGPDAVFDAVAHLENLLGATLDRAAVIEQRSQRKAELCDASEILPGVVRYLADARTLGLKTAIVTRASDDWVQHHLQRVQIDHEWDTVVCANGNHRRAKSDLYREALESLPVHPRHVIAFEDSANGVRAAKEAGIRCVAVPNGITRGQSLEGADIVLGSLAERGLSELIAAIEMH